MLSHFIYFYYVCDFFFKTMSHSISQVSKSRNPLCLCLLGAGIPGMSHHSQFKMCVAFVIDFLTCNSSLVRQASS